MEKEYIEAATELVDMAYEIPQGPQPEKRVMPKSGFDEINLNPVRGARELYCDYKCRMWWANRIIKYYLKGRVIWPGHKGTKHGSFGTVSA